MLKKWTVLMALAVAGSAWADVNATEAWSRVTAPSVPTGAVFLQLHNNGTKAEALVSATSDVAKKVELHTSINDNGVMRMRQVPKIDVAAGSTVMLQPGGYHIMLLGLKQPLKLNQTFAVTLKYDSGRMEKVTVMVHNGKGIDMKDGHSMDMSGGHMHH